MGFIKETLDKDTRIAELQARVKQLTDCVLFVRGLSCECVQDGSSPEVKTMVEEELLSHERFQPPDLVTILRQYGCKIVGLEVLKEGPNAGQYCVTIRVPGEDKTLVCLGPKGIADLFDTALTAIEAQQRKRRL